MNIGYIGTEYRLNENESLVHLRVEDETKTSRHYVTIAIHPVGKPVTFSESERVSPQDAQGVFTHRAFFNGRNAKSYVNKQNAENLGLMKIQVPGVI